MSEGPGNGHLHLQGMVGQLRINVSRYELAYMREVTVRDEADQQHRDILAAVEAREPDRAAELLETHWHHGMRLVLEWLERTA